jgi:signal transduction histidine kinase
LIRINTCGNSGHLRSIVADMHLIHDLRLVLISLGACLQELRRRPPTRRPSSEIEQASRLVETGLSLVNELLVDRALKPIAPAAEVNAILEDMDALLTTIIGPEVGVRTRLAAGDTHVYAQRADLERIMLNLAFNASDLSKAIDPLALPEPDGTGIGLASVSLILARLGGRLAIESAPDKGTRVSILLPLAGSLVP